MAFSVQLPQILLYIGNIFQIIGIPAAVAEHASSPTSSRRIVSGARSTNANRNALTTARRPACLRISDRSPSDSAPPRARSPHSSRAVPSESFARKSYAGLPGAFHSQTGPTGAWGAPSVAGRSVGKSILSRWTWPVRAGRCHLFASGGWRPADPCAGGIILVIA